MNFVAGCSPRTFFEEGQNFCPEEHLSEQTGDQELNKTLLKEDSNKIDRKEFEKSPNKFWDIEQLATPISKTKNIS